MILETIITTRNEDGGVHLAPMGVHDRDGQLVLAPFRPSRSLDNLLRERTAVINCTDDVRVFAGCLTGRRTWPTLPAAQIAGARLADALSHTEVSVENIEDDPVRPRLLCRTLHSAIHRPFRGFNRAQSAVIEAAILVSRLHMLSPEKVDAEVAYLTIGVEKTAGAHEREAWEWLMEAIRAHRTGSSREASV